MRFTIMEDSVPCLLMWKRTLNIRFMGCWGWGHYGPPNPPIGGLWCSVDNVIDNKIEAPQSPILSVVWESLSTPTYSQRNTLGVISRLRRNKALLDSIWSQIKHS